MVDEQSSLVAAERPLTVIERPELANSFLRAVSEGENGGINWKIEAGEDDKLLLSFVTNRTRSIAHASISATSFPIAMTCLDLLCR
jgi:hypothetical protein